MAMGLLILSFMAGLLTIAAPCVLPVIPFVLARAGGRFHRDTLPLLLGLGLTFALAGALATAAGTWVVTFSDWSRSIALVVLAVLGLTLLWPRLASWVARPFVQRGNRLIQQTSGVSPMWASVIMGVATGLLWAPCAGPILGLVLTTSALQHDASQTFLWLLAYALGAVTAMGVVLMAATWTGTRLVRAMPRLVAWSEGLRRAAGGLVLAGVAMSVTGLDMSVQRLLPGLGTDQIEQQWLRRWSPSTPKAKAAATWMPVDLRTPAPLNLSVEGALPELQGLQGWLNSPALSRAQLRGKVVLIDFWTFGCINCQRAIPYVQKWHERYKDQGLVVIGIHAPEFAYERDPGNVRRAVSRMGLSFAVASDNDFQVWRAFDNRYWPALYLIDAQGRIRYHHFGEGAYDTTPQAIEQLLKEARERALQS
jgi:cytochrome c biogenesis protein CcdA/thiol-disulfide isomerase/thioredoxin